MVEAKEEVPLVRKTQQSITAERKKAQKEIVQPEAKKEPIYIEMDVEGVLGPKNSLGPDEFYVSNFENIPGFKEASLDMHVVGEGTSIDTLASQGQDEAITPPPTLVIVEKFLSVESNGYQLIDE